MVFINKTKGFEVRFRYNLVISNDFVMRINSKALLIIKRMISLGVNMNEIEEAAISSLSVLNDRFITNFKSDARFKSGAFKTITVFNEIFFGIEMKLSRSSIFFSTIICFF